MGAVAWAVWQRPVSHPRSSNRTCGFPASGFPTGFTVRPRQSTAQRVRSIFASRHSSLGQVRPLQVFAGSSANHPDLAIFESAPEVRALPSAGVTRLQRSYDPVRLPLRRRPSAALRPLPSSQTGLPRLPASPFRRAVPTTPADRTGARVDCFPVHAAFPALQAGRHPHLTFEACSGFTHVTARRIAQPPKAAFVTRLQPGRLPDQPLVSYQSNRQLSGWNPPPL